MYNTVGWGLEYLHINVRYIYKLNKEHKPLYIYIIVGYVHAYA